MTYFMDSLEEIYAYFRIPSNLQEEHAKRFTELINQNNGNVPQVFEVLSKSSEFPSEEKLIFTYALGIMLTEMRLDHELQRIIASSVKKGMEIGKALPKNCSGNIEVTKTSQGIAVNIVTDKGDNIPVNPEIPEKKIPDPMYR